MKSETLLDRFSIESSLRQFREESELDGGEQDLCRHEPEGDLFDSVRARLSFHASQGPSDCLRLRSGDDAPVTEGRFDLDFAEAGFLQHRRQLAFRVLLSRHRNELIDVACRDWKRASSRIVKEHFVNNDASARWQTLEALACKKLASLGWPVMEDQSIEVQVGIRIRVVKKLAACVDSRSATLHFSANPRAIPQIAGWSSTTALSLGRTVKAPIE